MSELLQASLGDLVQITKGKKPVATTDRPKSARHKPYLLIESFSGEYRLFTDDSSCPLAKRQDTLLVWDGECGLSSSGHEGYIGSTLAAISKNSEIIDSCYLYHFISSKRQDIRNSAEGTAVPHVSRRFLESIQVYVPPVHEQKKIAKILSGIDLHVEILKKKTAKASMLSSALGNKIFSSLDGEKIALGEICNPKQWQTISTSQLTASGYPVYGANGQIGYFTEYNHKDPVLAVTCRGATCGNLALVPGFSYVTGNSMCLDNPRNDTSPEYLFHFLSWRGLKDVISGSAQPQITRSPLQAVEVILPSKDKQDKIISALESLKRAECSVKTALDHLDLLKQAVSSDLLSGRKRVSV